MVHVQTLSSALCLTQDPAARKRFDESVAISQFIFANGIWGTRILDLLATHIGLPPNQLYIDSTPTMIARTTLGGVRVNLPKSTLFPMLHSAAHAWLSMLSCESAGCGAVLCTQVRTTDANVP